MQTEPGNTSGVDIPLRRSAPTGDRAPIFIVGAPRSGTTLLAALLSAHTAIACGPETQFFSKLSAGDLRSAVEDPRWPLRATDLVASLTLAGQPVIDLFGLDRPDLRCRLACRPPAVASMLEVLTRSSAERAGKRRWAEKTPNHLLHLDAIREAWPEARVIRIVRDPRDSADSMCRLPWASRSVLANAYLWADWHRAGRSFFASDELSCSLRFEDLVAEPENSLALLCDFLGERFEPDMLDTRSTGVAVASAAETWKQEVAGPIDRDRGARWRETLPPDIARCVSLVCAEALEEFGYETEVRTTRTLRTLRLDRVSIESNEGDLLSLGRRGIRLVGSTDPLREVDLGVLRSAPDPRRRAERAAVVLARRLLGRTTSQVGRIVAST